MNGIDSEGWFKGVMQIPSPNFDLRPVGSEVSLIVIHSISLPPGVFSGSGVTSLFTSALDPARHDFYRSIDRLRVSAHLFVRREGAVVQYAPLSARAWHAGVSRWNGRDRCNDFSIGIELEGSDDSEYSDAQYRSLFLLLEELLRHYPVSQIVGHEDIAPGRKTDPGPFFDWMLLASRFSCVGRKLGNSS